MGKRYLIDTNIAIYLLDGNMPPNTIEFLEKIIDNEYFISVISKMELLGFDFSDASKNEITAAFVSESSLVQLTEEVIKGISKNSQIFFKSNNLGFFLKEICES
jgi:predicted nucleic acid-binding protein